MIFHFHFISLHRNRASYLGAGTAPSDTELCAVENQSSRKKTNTPIRITSFNLDKVKGQGQVSEMSEVKVKGAEGPTRNHGNDKVKYSKMHDSVEDIDIQDDSVNVSGVKLKQNDDSQTDEDNDIKINAEIKDENVKVRDSKGPSKTKQGKGTNKETKQKTDKQEASLNSSRKNSTNDPMTLEREVCQN